jgi:hypothetical protein
MLPLLDRDSTRVLYAVPFQLTEFSQLPTFFRFFALIFIVKPRVFIIAF